MASSVYRSFFSYVVSYFYGTSTNHLPFEIISLILEYVDERDLYPWTLANKYYYMTTNPILWRSPHIENFGMARKFINSLRQAKKPVGRYIRTITLEEITWNDNDFILVMQHAGLLEEIYMSFSTAAITNKSLRQLPHLCPNLTSLHLGDLFIMQQYLHLFTKRPHVPKVFHQYIPAVRASRSTLRHDQLCIQPLTANLDYLYEYEPGTPFSPNRGNRFDPDTFSALFGCPLEELTIVKPPPNMLKHPAKTAAILTRFHSLTHLTLYRIPMNLLECLLLKSHAWPCLVELAIEGYPRNGGGDSGAEDYDDFDIVDGHGHGFALIPFLRSHPGLKALHLVYGKLSNTLLDRISDIQHPGITKLILNGNRKLSSVAIRRLIRYWTLLKYVSIGTCRIKPGEFLEASSDCIDPRVDIDEKYRQEKHLAHLDQEAINKIRLGS